jgi:hypothetical protein
MDTKNETNAVTDNRRPADRIVDQLFRDGAEAVQIQIVDGVYRFTGYKVGAGGLGAPTGAIETSVL